ncbi:hypothetical protein GCM10011415_23250 [Salipiger pallidus]|uniref:Uncharacterized protein n=1 Tax=Salipiger pallidus TaxID=1775170 RepID=A0A8J2ZKP0_9RHOB|nr:hypothetical protein GCM10011415_23250 [Salipiger pallidus]
MPVGGCAMIVNLWSEQKFVTLTDDAGDWSFDAGALYGVPQGTPAPKGQHLGWPQSLNMREPLESEIAPYRGDY